MGSGGMIVMDANTCMVDVSKYFLDFLRYESCGKCTSCRDGLGAMHGIVSNICEGKGKEGDMGLLQELSEAIQLASLCELGKSAPNLVLTTLRYFRGEYESHIRERKCPAGVCSELVEYRVDPEKCKACRLCVKNCPQEAFRGEKKEAPIIDTEKCIKCGVCLESCKIEAILVE